MCSALLEHSFAPEERGIRTEYLRSEVGFIRRSIKERLEGQTAFLLRQKYTGLYAKGPDFGPKFEELFQDAIFDAEEAGKSLATDCYTACVFHLMRAMEVTLGILAQQIGATIRNEHDEVLPWGILLSNIKGKIDKMPKGATQDDWLRIHSLFHSVNRAFRTKTAHPGQKYTQTEAEDAMNAVCGYMREIAKLEL